MKKINRLPHLSGLLIVFVTVLLCLTLLPTKANAATSGTCGKSLTWMLNNTGTLTISGTGEMYDYTSSSDVPWWSYSSSVKSVIINDGVTSIGDYAFDYFQKLTSVTLPNSVTSIGAYAFRSCIGLTTVRIPNSVTEIGKRAFEECTNLTSITIPDSVTSLGEALFIYCSKLASISLGDGITSIPTDAFYYCTSLKSVNIPYGVTSIGKSAFSWCAFTSVSIPASVNSIGQSAFQSCNNLTTVTIPGSVVTIEDKAFATCKLLSGIWVSEDNSNYSSDANGVLFNKTKSTLISAPTALAGNYEIPDSVLAIESQAFCQCNRLTSVAIPDSVVSIGDDAFSDCTSIKYNTYDNAKYLGNSNNPYLLLVAAVSTNITSCNIHPQTRFVGSGAFLRCSSLTEITIHDNIISIGVGAFGSNSYNGCSKLNKVLYCGTQSQWDNITIGSSNTYLTNANRLYHNLSDATCTTPPICTLCGDSVGEALGHSGEQWFDILSPTCSEAGIKARICTVCSTTETVPVDALGHSNTSVVTAPTCTEQGYTTNACNVCGEVTVTDYVAATGHSNTSAVTAPTCTEQGFTTNTCSVCGEVSVTNYIEAKGHTWSAWIQTAAPTCTAEGSQMRFCNCGTRETQAIAKLAHTYENGICTVCGDLGSYYWVLSADANVDLTLAQDLYVDLNGFDLSGTITTNGYQIYGMDSTTNTYSCENVGYFNCVDENGNGIIPVRQFKTDTDMTGEIRRYMAIEAESGFTFHRFYLGITSTSLNTATTGVGYKAVFYGDDMVKGQLDSFGFTMQLEGGNAISRYKTAEEFVSGKTVTLRINNYDAANYGETALYASVCMQLSDGTLIQSAEHSVTLRGMIESVNRNYTSYSADQLAAVNTMIDNNPAMQAWEVGNIYKKETA